MASDFSNELELDNAPSHRREEDLDQSGSGVQRLVYSCPVDHAGTSVYVKGWYRTELKATPVLFVHDVGEHFGLYREAAMDICTRGHNVYGFDLRGHGRSGRRAGHIPKFSFLIKDLLQVCAWVKNREKGRRPIIVGQGVGALIVLNFHKYYAKHCAGVVLASPSIELIKQPNAIRSWIVRILAESSPTIRLPKFLRPKITDSAAVSVSAIKTNQGNAGFDISHKITARYAHEVLQAIERSSGHLKILNGESLILCPEADNLCRYNSILQTVAGLKERDLVRVEMIANAGHQLFSGEESDRTIATTHLLNWLEGLESRLATFSPPNEASDSK